MEKLQVGPRSMGPVLRELGNGEVIVTMRQDDFNIVQVQGPQGQPMAAPARTLIVVQARAFREFVPGSDIWELRVPEDTPAGTANALVYVHGKDILCLKVMSKVAT